MLRVGAWLPVGEGQSSVRGVFGSVPNPYGIWNSGEGGCGSGRQTYPLSNGPFGIRTKPGGRKATQITAMARLSHGVRYMELSIPPVHPRRTA